TLMSEKSRNLLYVSRLVGGQIYSRNRAGDPDAKPALMLLEPKKQREALAAISDTVLRDDFFLADAELYNALGSSRWSDWASNSRTCWRLPTAILAGWSLRTCRTRCGIRCAS